MYGRIALLLSLFYLLLNVLVVRWTCQKPKEQLYDDEEYMKATLKKLLFTRHVGSRGHEAVRDFLDKEIMHLGYFSRGQDFFQGINYSNVVGFWNDMAIQYLVLTCHYDGPIPRKGQEKDVQVSATDGAVSCAILLTLTKTLKIFAELLGRNTGLAIVFFDGHESDSVNKPLLVGSKYFVNSRIIPASNIALVLTLNHIGAPHQTFPSFSENGDKMHIRLMEIEQELRKSGKLVDCHDLFQKKRTYTNDLPDDHVPFKENGVTVLHIAPENNSNVHHTAENLHWPTILNMIKILRIFITEYMVSINHDDFEIDFYEYYYDH